MSWLAWAGIALGTLIVVYAVAMIWSGMQTAGKDHDEGGHH